MCILGHEQGVGRGLKMRRTLFDKGHSLAKLVICTGQVKSDKTELILKAFGHLCLSDIDWHHYPDSFGKFLSVCHKMFAQCAR
jgi:hypothetical protein